MSFKRAVVVLSSVLVLIGCGGGGKESPDAAWDSGANKDAAPPDGSVLSPDAGFGIDGSATGVIDAPAVILDTQTADLPVILDGAALDSVQKVDAGDTLPKDASGQSDRPVVDAGVSLDAAASPDMSNITDGDLLSDSGLPDALAQTCSTPGATECKNPLKIRTCSNGVWVESSCGDLEICSPEAPAACRPACPGLVLPSKAVAACFMPFDPTAAYAAAMPSYNSAPVTTVAVTSDQTGLSGADINGAAFDTLDLSSSKDEICASVTTDSSLGPIWNTPASTRFYGRIYIWGTLSLKTFGKKYGGRPAGVSLYVKTRKLANPAALSPVPLFTLQNGEDVMITSLENNSSSLTPTTTWAIQHRDFSADELELLSVDGTDNYWELDYTSGEVSLPLPTLPPENVEIAWYAVVLSPSS